MREAGCGAVDMILAYPTVMKRPLLETDSGCVVGFDERAYEAIDF